MSLDLSALRKQLQSENIDILRLVYADVLGIPRSKDLVVSQM
jgi:glutamine synthetase